MNRAFRTSAAIVACATAGVVLAGCDEAPQADSFTGAKKIQVDGHSVNVSCSGSAAADRPLVLLLHGGGDALDKLAGFQATLAQQDRVCSYDRLGAGASDQPDGPQSFESTGKVLTGVIDQLAGDAPVVLAGHSLGGLIAARYAPEHQDKVKGLVLMDATPATQIADFAKVIPASATGQAAELRTQTLAIFAGDSPEKLVIRDADVRSAGDIPVEVIRHGQPYLAAVPEYGPGLEQAWADGQQKWLGLSSHSALSVAQNSGHYIYVDEPDLAVQKIRSVTGQVADSD